MGIVVLRDYQTEAAVRMEDGFKKLEHPLCVLPTGGGKSLVLATVAERAARRGSPVLVLSHMKELLEQDSAALRSIAPDISQSFYSAGLREKRGHLQVVFGGVQSVYRSLPALGRRDLLLIDEAHLAPRDADAMYAKVFKHFSIALRGGFTATNQRLDSGTLTSGPDAWFSNVCYEVEVTDLIKRGYLVPLSGVLTEHQANLDAVKSRMGDFIQGQAERAVRKLSTSEVVEEIIVLAQRRRHWLIFAAGVEHAKEVVEEMRKHGIDAEMVVAKTPADERAKLINRFREGRLRALVNVGVLTTGFDAPQTDCLISMRPTKSPILWQQIMGRGMRLAPGKKSCLLLDFVGNLERLGGAGCVIQMEDRRADISVARREVAQQRAMAAKPVEPEMREVSLVDPMKSGISFECYVQSVSYAVIPSRRFAGKNLLIVTYKAVDDIGTLREIRSFVPVEYAGSARFNAVRWFHARGVPEAQVPRDSRTALALAKVSPEPKVLVAYWDGRLKSYLVSEERFSSPVAQASLI